MCSQSMSEFGENFRDRELAVELPETMSLDPEMMHMIAHHSLFPVTPLSSLLSVQNVTSGRPNG